MAKKKAKKKKEPVWKGPEVDGITYSLLCRFLVCRERFRLLVIEGLKPIQEFNQRIEYGSMWHIMEEEHAKRDDRRRDTECGIVPLRSYCQCLCKQYPLQQEQIQHWMNVCKVQFPLYVDYWSKHPDVKNRTPLLQEQTFDVPYELPFGRMVRLRGKWDSVDLIGKGRNAGIYEQENKTKGDINEQQMLRQLSSGFDLQTMMYLVALKESLKEVHAKPPLQITNIFTGVKTPWEATKAPPIRGIRYNVVRRPLSGGKGSIRQHKATKTKPEETAEHFYERLGGIIAEDPGHFFMRWKVEVASCDIERFRRECLDPILGQLCDWWDHLSVDWSDPFGIEPGLEGCGIQHWRHPYGVWNSLNEGRNSELDEYLASGSTLGLTRVDNLFPEL